MTSAPSQPAAARPPPKKPPLSQGALDERKAIARFGRIKKVVTLQTWVIAALVLALLIIMPFAQPVFLYYAMNPDHTLVQMSALSMPNMTNRAILAWTTTSVTEIMTMGFGDMDVKIPKQRKRFTPNGWKAYIKAFEMQKVAETFKQNQLVLTTVPSNSPVVIYQGVNPDQVYEWVVQMPIIMAYATNNNVTSKKKGIATLTIVRVSAEDSVDGIAIENWILH